MKFTIIGPTKTEELEIDWIELQLTSGGYVIKEGHAPMISLLQKDKELIIGLKDGSKTIMTISGAIVHVDRKNVLILITDE